MKTSFFIGEHLTKYTVQMDFDRSEKNLYLTMRVSAIEIVEVENLFDDLYIDRGEYRDYPDSEHKSRDTIDFQ